MTSSKELGHMVNILSRFFFSSASKSQPNCAACLIMSCLLCSKETYIPISLSFTPSFMNWRPIIVFPVPGVPETMTMLPSGKPPSMSASRPIMPLLTFFTEVSIYYLLWRPAFLISALQPHRRGHISLHKNRKTGLKREAPL